MIAISNPRQDRHRFTLGTGGHQNDLVIWVLVDVLQLNNRICVDIQKAELAGNRHVANHTAPHEGDLAAICNRSIQNLLDSMNMRGEGSNHYLARGLGNHRLDNRTNVPLQRSESRDISVGGINHEKVKPLFANLGKGP